MLAAISISVITLCFIAYYFATTSGVLHRYFLRQYGEEKTKSRWVVFQRSTGLIFFGVVPLLLSRLQGIGLAEIGLHFDSRISVWGWILGLSAVCVLINYYSCRNPDHLAMYPQIRTPQPWSRSLHIISSATLFLYTLAYEVMFRGYLLFTCERELGALVAIVINTSIYMLVHLPKGWKETIGALPMGVVLCGLTLQSGNIWIAVAVHTALAWSSEWFSIAQHRKGVGRRLRHPL